MLPYSVPSETTVKTSFIQRPDFLTNRTFFVSHSVAVTGIHHCIGKFVPVCPCGIKRQESMSAASANTIRIIIRKAF